MYTETNLPQTEEHLFTELDTFNYRDASLGQRFLNFLIDYIALQLTVGVALGFILGMIIGSYFPEFGLKVYSEKGFPYYLFSWVTGATSFVVYYTFCETVFKGYTLGKLITGTRALRTDGTPPSFMDALNRSLCRVIPFEPLSALGPQPWHDSMTETMVIKSRQ